MIPSTAKCLTPDVFLPATGGSLRIGITVLTKPTIVGTAVITGIMWLPTGFNGTAFKHRYTPF